MRLILGCFNAGWLRVSSLLIPVGPPLGLGARDERAWEQLAEGLG
jgi:hypothetical protein